MSTRPSRFLALGSLVLVAASCGGGKAPVGTTAGTGGTSASATTGSGAGSGSGSGGGPGAASSSSATSSSSGGTGGAATCLASALLTELGVSHVLVGAAMADATASATPFDGRYQYISGGIFDGAAPCTSCLTSCTSAGTTCAAGACGWWGCWQDTSQAPGQFVVGFDGTAKTDGQIPMYSLYEVLQASGVTEGTAEAGALNDAAFLTRYLANFRFLLQRIGSSTAFVHIEPDFWGYAEQANGDPHALPAPVQSANAADCGAQENSIAGVGHCMIAMTRKYAPHARVGLHASAWGTNMDVLGNTDPTFDVAGEAAKLGNFLLAAGAGDGDFVVADMSDRDAGWYQSQGKNTWWDATNATLPNFHQAFAWAKAVAETVGKPIVWWQIPVGNMNMPNSGDQWKDNRVDYLFAHLDEVAAAHGVGLYFGAGDGVQTTPETDGGNLVARVKAYHALAGGGQPACP